MPGCHRQPVHAYPWDISMLPPTVSANAAKHACNGIAPHFNSHPACFSAGDLAALFRVAWVSQHGTTLRRADMSLVMLKVNQIVLIFAFQQF